MRILQHLLPSRELSPDTLRDIARKLKDGGIIEGTDVSTAKEETNLETTADPEVEEVEDLHGQLGCLMEDSLGEYREGNYERKKLLLTFTVQATWEHMLRLPSTLLYAQ